MRAAKRTRSRIWEFAPTASAPIAIAAVEIVAAATQSWADPAIEERPILCLLTKFRAYFSKQRIDQLPSVT
jgi:hypothetical protein